MFAANGEQSLKMQITGFSLLQAMAEKMKWHQARQTLLAENVANADTPGYVGRDLAPFRVDEGSQSLAATLSMSTSSPSHISISSGGADGFADTDSRAYQTTPDGNSVTLEEEMMKVSANEADYQTVAALYTRSLKLIRTALGKTA